MISGEVKCGDSVFTSPEIKVRPIFNTNNDVLPLNADEFDLLKFCLKANESDLNDLGLSQQVKNSKEKLRIRLTEALALLNTYRVTYADLDNLITKKLKE